MPTKDLTVAIKSTYDGKGTTAAEKGLAQSEEKARGFEKALKGQEDQAKRSERALGQYESQLKRSSAQLDAVGSSALRTRRLLEDATRRLPRLDIEADLSQPERQVAELAEQLRELSGRRIGIDIDAGDAERRVAEIRRDLMRLEATHPEVVVSANVERAIVALERAEREARKVDGRVAKIHIEVDEEPVGRFRRAVEQAFGALEQMAPRSVAGVAVAIAALPAVSAVVAGGIVATLGSALAGLGLAAASGSEEAQDALAHLRVTAQAEAQRIGQPFEQVWTQIVLVAERELARLSPVIADALADLAPDVMAFTDQAGASLEELEPAIQAVQRAFSAVLRELGPAMPQIMGDLASAITYVAEAVERNPEAFAKMAVSLAALIEQAGMFIAVFTDVADVVSDNWAVFRTLAMAAGLMIPDLATVSTTGDAAGQGLREMGAGAGAASAALKGSAAATGEQAEATKQMLAAWSQAYQAFGSVVEAMSAAQSGAEQAASRSDRIAQAQERAAEVARANAERIARAARDLADAEEQGAQRIADAHRRTADVRERAAEQAEQADRRVKDSKRAQADAVAEAAEREADAEERLAEARRRAGDVARDGARAIADAKQRVADATADAAERELAAEQRQRDSHARTQQAVEDLDDARARAAERLKSLAESVDDIPLDEEDAQIAVERARRRLDELNAKGAEADPLDRREAEQALRRAEDRLEKVRARAAELRKELEEANKAGVDGAAEVVQAQERIAEAQRAEQEAAAGLAKARAEGARQVADAEKALADAREQAARQQQDAARAIADAEAEANKARIDGAREVQRATRDVADAEKEAAKTARDSARDIADAQAAEQQARKDSARAIADAERSLADARQQAARDTLKANREVQESWVQLTDSAATTTQELFAELEKQAADQRRWKDNLVSLAGRVPDELFDELVKAGPAGARAVALAAGMTDAELQKFVALYGLRGKGAAELFAENMRSAGPALREIARTQGSEVAEKVREGMDGGRINVRDAARRLGLEIDEGIGLGRIRVIKVQLGDLDELMREKNEMLNRERGGIERYAVGAVRRSTPPMIASRPTILFGEGRGDEGFVPYDMQYRSRAEQIMGQIASDFGGLYLRPGDLGAMGGGGGTVTHVTTVYKSYSIAPQVPPGTDLAAVGAVTVKAIQAYESRSGATWRRTIT